VFYGQSDEAMSPTFPMLAIRRDVAFWVEESMEQCSTANVQTLANMGWTSILHYDSEGVLWPTIEVAPVGPIGWLDRVLPWRKVAITLGFGEGAKTHPGEVAHWLCDIIDGHSGFDWHDGPAPGQLKALFLSAETPEEVIAVARRIE
jgi:hypothetical protein